MAGKGGKGLLAAKTTAAQTAEKDKGKKAPISRSSRAGLQVNEHLLCFVFEFQVMSFYFLTTPPYKTDALEPYMSRRAVELHWGKRQQDHVDGLNKQLAISPLYGRTLEDLIKEAYNNGNPLPEHNDAAEIAEQMGCCWTQLHCLCGRAGAGEEGARDRRARTWPAAGLWWTGGGVAGVAVSSEVCGSDMSSVWYIVI